MRMTCFANKITKCTNDLYTHWRKLGAMIAAAKAAGQITKVHNRPKSVVPDENNAFTLEEIGITRKESMRAQRIAAVAKRRL